MDYSMDPLSEMLLGDLELFPECFLPDGLDKSDPVNNFAGHDYQAKSVGNSSTPSLTDDVFPDWLDLKMDMALLEGLETPNVLDDLLLGEVATGQSVDILPALQVEAKAFSNPLDLDQLSCQQIPLSIHSSQAVSPPLDAVSSPQQSPPSSPEWQVPDIISYSQSFFPSVSEPGSPGYLVQPIPSPPPSAQDTVLPLVASVVPSVSVVVTAETPVSSPALSLDSFLSFPLLLGGENVCIQMIQPNVTESETSSPPNTPSPTPPPLVVEKTKRVKIKASRNLKKNPPKAQFSKTLEKDSDDEDDGGEDGFSGPISKKERKRKQNKDAAMRYRIKKRMETDVMAGEEKELLEENKKLKDKAQQLSNELSYLKNLMREMFKVKGLL